MEVQSVTLVATALAAAPAVAVHLHIEVNVVSEGSEHALPHLG